MLAAVLDAFPLKKIPARLRACRRHLRHKLADAVVAASTCVIAGTSSIAIADNVRGTMDAVIDWPLVSVSMANLPDGRILSYSGSERRTWPTTERTYSAVWDPQSGAFTERLMQGHNMFCGTMSMTSEGGVFVTGGRNGGNSPWTSLFDYNATDWGSLDNMASGGRWYPTTLALGDGRIMTAMGNSTNVRNPDVWDPQSGWRVLNGIDFLGLRQRNNNRGRENVFPLLSLAPDGNVFHFWDKVENHAINTSGAGASRAFVADSDAPNHQGGIQVYYDEGRLLITGRNDGSWGGNNGDRSSREAFTVDLNGAVPVMRATSPMIHPRKYHQLIPLPTGEVLVVGGNRSGAKFQDNDSVMQTEIWNPQTGQWRETAALAVPRDYHSTALLMHDGRVITAGGGYHPGDPNSGGTHQDAQIFNPPYLFASNGQLAPRPTVTSAVEDVETGQTFNVSTTGDIDYFSMIRLSATTHAINTDARFLRPQFRVAGVNSFDITLNSNPNVASPGYWMLFAVDTNGVPSVADVIKVGSVDLRLDNLALLGTATQSSTFANNFAADNAIDGNLSGASVSGSLTHTNSDLNAWWHLDLGRNNNIESIRLWNRTDCCDQRLSDFYVLVSEEPFVSNDLAATRAQEGVSEYLISGAAPRQTDIDIGRLGRYVRVQLTGQNFLQLAEVQVFGSRPDFPNVASGGTANQSSTWSNNDNFAASKAIDGDTRGTSVSEVSTLGGLGGAPFDLSCGTGQVLVGIFGATGDFVNGVGPRCVSVNTSGNWTGSVQNGAATANPTNGTTFNHTCPADHAVSGFSGRADNFVNAIQLDCQPLTSATRVNGTIAALPQAGANSGAAQGPYSCSGFAATGLTGRSGSWMDRISLQCPESGGSITGTTRESQPWWQVDLGSAYSIDSVRFWQRTDCCQGELRDVHVFVSNTPFTGTTPTQSSNQDGVTAFFEAGVAARENEVVVSRVGRYVRIQLDSADAVLSLAEVEIFGTATAPLQLEPLRNDPIPVADGYTFSASATGTGVTYSWAFGDGNSTAFASSASTTHTYATPGRYVVSVTARDSSGNESTESFTQIVHPPLSSGGSQQSSGIVEHRNTGEVWNVNPDNDSVAATDPASGTLLAEVAVGDNPRALAQAPNGDLWVVNKGSASISVIDASTRTVTNTITLSRHSQPHGIVFGGGSAYVVLEARGEVLRLSAASRLEQARTPIGSNPRHLSINADGSRLYVSRYITPPLPGEATANPVVNDGVRDFGGEIVVMNATPAVVDTIVLAYSDRIASENEGPGIPNYLGPAVIAPDGQSAWVPSKQDNILAGDLRGGDGMTFDQTVRAISSFIDLGTGTETLSRRIDHDNASVSSHAALDPYGVTLFTALEGNRQIALTDAYTSTEIGRFNVGMAPQSIAISSDGSYLYVHNYMQRSVGIYDITSIVYDGGIAAFEQAVVSTVTNEALPANILRGKQLFNDARDDRLAALDYMSCASCHNDGAHDGRTWDFTSLGEGLRNTISLKGHSGMAHGRLHWSSNFDELQDFEDQIRTFAGGSGLMDEADFFNTIGPLGAPKAGLSEDLDALAAYMANLTTIEPSPFKPADDTYSAQALAGRNIFNVQGCASCHAGTILTDSPTNALHDIGSLNSDSGNRLGGPLDGIDTPTLLGVWNTAPYLHNGSAADLQSAITAHTSLTLSATELQQLEALLLELDNPAQFLSLADADADGVPDSEDAFPNDPTESTDSDDDGVGDNADAFPQDASETTDSDGDGVGDNSDAFPDDPLETVDTDADGIGDNSDAFPQNPAEWVDSNNNGLGDNEEGRVASITLPATLNDTISAGEWQYYLVENSDTAEAIEVSLQNLSADVDLYLRGGQAPTTSAFYCRSWRGGSSDENCEAAVDTSAPMFIGLYGVRDASFTLTVAATSSSPQLPELADIDQILTPGAAFSGNLVQREWSYYRVDNPDGLIDALIQLDEISADADLYLRRDALPTLEAFSCRSFNLGNAEESCEIDFSVNGVVYVGVYGFRAGTYRLTLSGNNPHNPIRLWPLELDNQRSDFVALTAYNYYEIIDPLLATTAVVVLDNLSADVDLYTREGALPTVTSHDCASENNSTYMEACSANLTPENQTTFVGVHGYRSGSYDLTVYPAGADGGLLTEIAPGDTVNTSVTAGEWSFYQVNNLDTVSDAAVTLTNLSDDVDLFVREGGLPTLSAYDCGSNGKNTEAESCMLPDNPEALVFIGVYGHRAGSFTLSVSGLPPVISPAFEGDGSAILVSEETKVFAGKWNYYEVVTPTNGATLHAELADNAIGAEMFVRRGARPNYKDNDCGPALYPTRDNYCELATVAGEIWYVGVYSEQGTGYNIDIRTVSDDDASNSEENQGTNGSNANGNGNGNNPDLTGNAASGISAGGATDWQLLLLLMLLLLTVNHPVRRRRPVSSVRRGASKAAMQRQRR